MDKRLLIVVLIASSVGYWVGFAWGCHSAIKQTQNEAIKAGVAYYAPSDGKFTWKEIKP